MAELKLPNLDMSKLENAIRQVALGSFNKAEVDGAQVYKVKNVIRIDIKCKEVAE